MWFLFKRFNMPSAYMVAAIKQNSKKFFFNNCCIVISYLKKLLLPELHNYQSFITRHYFRALKYASLSAIVIFISHVIIDCRNLQRMALGVVFRGVTFIPSFITWFNSWNGERHSMVCHNPLFSLRKESTRKMVKNRNIYIDK